MEKYLVTFIFGTRPEAIKLAPVILAFKSDKNFLVRVIFTGQHQEMALSVLDLFKICIDKNLKVMKTNQSLSYLTSTLLNKLSNELELNRPKLVIVQGDTTSAFVGSLASFYKQIPIAHVEAGLRTNNIYEPFPEEANRRIISQISSLNFAPTQKAASNLRNEGIKSDIFVTGNTVIDALKIIDKKNIENFNYDFDNNKKTILLTVHRRENWGSNLISIIDAVKKIILNNPNIFFIVPMHKNHKVRDHIIENLSNQKNVNLIEPLKYDEFVFVMKNSFFIMTDSGGIQEEAPAFGKPVLILRNKTERPEALDVGSSKLLYKSIEAVKFLLLKYGSVIEIS